MPEPLNPDLWKRVDELLDAALDLPPSEREAYLAVACVDDSKLRAEVLSLLNAEKQAGTFMVGSAMRVAARELANANGKLANALPVGRQLGKYRIERLLGAGGMGEVYLAREASLNRQVALKILPPQFVADAERVARFDREARVISALNHPNLVTIYEVGSVADLHFIAMEFIEGKTLSEWSGPTLQLREVLSIVAQVAEALMAAHQAGIVHRDIKPDNIMVRGDGYAKVLDFGLAKLTEVAPNGERTTAAQTQVAAAQTQAGAVMGTLVYMSPEQATGEALDHRTDIWSLGVVLYELLTGATPFKQDVRLATVKSILQSDPGSVRNSNPSLPVELDHIIEKALEKDRDLRYQTASDFRADLRRLLRAIDSSPSLDSSGSLLAARRAPRPRRWLWLVACLIVLSVVALAASRWFKAPPRGPDWSRSTHIQLTDQPGTEFFPSLAPDGKNFVYASKQNGNFDLFMLRVGGKNPRNLTADSIADETQPAFSPNGEHIAFRSERAPSGIYVMEATGENVRRIADGGFHPSWSPDGKEIVFSAAGRELPELRNTSPSSLWIVDVGTGVKRLLSRADAMQPSWSPNGKRIAYWFNPPAVGRRDVATVPSGGGEAVLVTKDGNANWNPVWSPDGHYLYYASDRGGNMNFWRVGIDQETGRPLSEPEAVVTPSKYSRHLNFSRDGKRLIYVQTDNRANLQAVEFDVAGERFTGEPFWITRGDHELTRPELSPDGQQFVLLMPRRTQDDLVLVNRDGSNFRDLTNDKFFDRWPRWSPDSKRIAFASDRSGNYEIWTIDADGTNLRQMTANSSSDASFPVWSPDGRELLCKRNLANIILDANKSWADQSPRDLPRLRDRTDTFVVWDWSPDGKKLAVSFRAGDTGIGYFSFETGRYEKVVDVDARPMWLPDSRRLIYAYNGKAYIADTVAKKVHEVYSRPHDEVRAFAVSRDARLAYFTVAAAESDIWLLDLQ